MKLHEIPKGSIIKHDCFDQDGNKLGDTITFHHIDGMYSYCTLEGIESPGNVLHLSAMTPLKKVDDHYEVDES